LSGKANDGLKLCALFFVSLDVRVKSDGGIKTHFSVFLLTVRCKAHDLQLYSVYNLKREIVAIAAKGANTRQSGNLMQLQ